MSRIGKLPITIPSNTTVTIDGQEVKVKGPKGELSFYVSFEVGVKIKGQEIFFEKIGKTKNAAALWGTSRALVQNMITGVTEGFSKQLELHGVGYKMATQGKKLQLSLGFSHPLELTIPEGLNVSIEKNVLTIEGTDRQQVGQFAAVIRKLRKVEPYKGKGFRYMGEQFIKKVGKRASGTE